ncbi:MAG TPA: type II CAAX endopeptidase family protein [Anaerolineae bacterium]|nr:type II CAAX endopeptidase family protein [Anaerolineae bacterium]
MNITTASVEPGAAQRPARSAQRGMVIYLVVAFGFTWAILGLGILAARGVITLPLSTTGLVTLATLGPMIAALSATAFEAGRAGVRTLLAQVVRWRVRPIWYGLALGVPAMIMLSAFVLWRVLGGPALPAPPIQSWLSLPVLVMALVIPALFEEIGWRGYALPRLQSRTNALAASLMLGLIHACWHVPLWFIPGLGFDSLPFPLYALLVIGLSILFTWLYNSTGGSLLIVGLFHAAINAYPAPWGAALQTLPESARGTNIQIAVAVTAAVFAICVVLLTHPRTLTRQRETG